MTSGGAGAERKVRGVLESPVAVGQCTWVAGLQVGFVLELQHSPSGWSVRKYQSSSS